MLGKLVCFETFNCECFETKNLDWAPCCQVQKTKRVSNYFIIIWELNWSCVYIDSTDPTNCVLKFWVCICCYQFCKIRAQCFEPIRYSFWPSSIIYAWRCRITASLRCLKCSNYLWPYFWPCYRISKFIWRNRSKYVLYYNVIFCRRDEWLNLIECYHIAGFL